MFALRKVRAAHLRGEKENPRVAQDGLYSLIELSIRKLGVLSPVYCTEGGIILSGHQRTKTIIAMGVSDIVVNIVNTKGWSEEKRLAVNFNFNRVLQEIEGEDTKAGIDVRGYLEALDDIDDIFRPLNEMTANNGEMNDDKEGVCKVSEILYRKGKIIVPVISNGVCIVNGLKRANTYMNMFGCVPMVISENAKNDVFKEISAAYDFEKSKDKVRVGQRRHFIRWDIPYTYKSFVPESLRKGGELLVEYMKRNYQRVLDFGAGNTAQSKYMRQRGVCIIPFEPFSIRNGIFDIEETRENITRFLDDYEEHGYYDAVVSNAVLNSVPFKEDVEKVVVLTKFLSIGSKVLVASSRNRVFCGDIKKTSSMLTKDENQVSGASKVKVQMFHGKDELQAMFEGGFARDDSDYSKVTVIKPKYKVCIKELIEAVNFEFGIKYMDRRLDSLRNRALSIFIKRHKEIYGE